MNAVGVVQVHCPVCGEAVKVLVQVARVSPSGFSRSKGWLKVEFLEQSPDHVCVNEGGN